MNAMSSFFITSFIPSIAPHKQHVLVLRKRIRLKVQQELCRISSEKQTQLKE